MKSALLPNWPTKKEILGVVPEHCMVKDTAKSMMYAVISTALTVGCGLAAYAWLPLQAAWSPVWLAYVPLRRLPPSRPPPSISLCLLPPRAQSLPQGLPVPALTLAPCVCSHRYALVAGTCATGSWVVAHECGHGAFSDNKTLQDTVGYVLHTVRASLRACTLHPKQPHRVMSLLHENRLSAPHMSCYMHSTSGCRWAGS